MIWKSLKEEWPYTNDEIWLKWTTDGVTWREEIVHEKKIDQIDCIGLPEWRPLDPPEWMNTQQKERFDELRGMGQATKVNKILLEDYAEGNTN